METTMKKMVKILAAAALFAAGVAIARAAEPVVVSAAPAPKIAGVEAAPAEGAQASTEAAKDDLFAGTEVFEKNASDVNEVTMDPDTLAMVGGKDKEKAHGMVLNVVRSYEYDKPGMYNMADVDRFRQKLNSGDWHCSIHTRDLKTGESTDICQKRRTDGLREQAIITVEPKQLTFIHTIMRGYGPGQSEMSGMSFGPMGEFGSLAAINPAQFAAMEAAMARLQTIGPKMQAEMGAMRFKHLQDGEQFKTFDKGKMKIDLDREMENARKELGEAQKEKHKAERDAQQESTEAERDAAKAKAEAEKQQENSNQPQ
ncbi:MAG: hypothetical protein V4555_21320 [Acidobacteriota bacterium]